VNSLDLLEGLTMIDAPVSLTVATLGRFEVRHHQDLQNGGSWNRRKVVELFKLLITAEQHRLHREQIQEILWPSSASEQATSSFGKTLYLLRRALEPELATTKGSISSYLILDHDVLLLAPGGISVDADRFEEEVKRLQVVMRNHHPGDTNRVDQADQLALLDEFDHVLALYGGDYLPEDLYEDWSQRRRDRLRRMHSWLLEHAATLAVACKIGQAACEYLQALLEHDATNEQTQCLLMQVYARMGRRKEALHQFQLLRETLRDELRAHPQPETLYLYRAIQAGRIPSDLAPTLNQINEPPSSDNPDAAPDSTPNSIRGAAPAEPTSARSQIQPEVNSLSAPIYEAEETQLDLLLRATPGSDLLQGVLVGRDKEMQRLQQQYAQIQQGTHSSLIICGEPGIGKTRLAREFAHWAEAQQPATILRGGCYEMVGSLPYHPIVEAITGFVNVSSSEELHRLSGPHACQLARIVPELRNRLPGLPMTEPQEPEMERSHLFNAVAHFFNRLAAERPLVIILDDLQWVDTATIHLLNYLMLAPTPSLLPATRPLYTLLYRADEVHESHALRGLLAALARFRMVEEMRLTRLSGWEVKQLLITLAGHCVSQVFVNEIYQHTEGNPFFLGETLISLLHEGKLKKVNGQWQTTVSLDELALPQSIRLLIERRLQRLSPECRTTLTLAAVLGRQFSSELLCCARGLSEESIAEHVDDAIRLHILSSMTQSHSPSRSEYTHGDQQDFDLSFTHDKIREVLYQRLNPLRRRTMHRQVAQALEQHKATSLETYHSLLAYHYQMAEDYQRAIEYFLSAARQASHVYAFAYSADCIEKALELLIGDEDRQQRAELLHHLSEETYLYNGHPDKAIEAGMASGALWHELGNVEKEAETHLDVAFAQHWQGREVEAIKSVQHALACLKEKPEEVRLHARAAAQWGMAAVNIGDTRTAFEQLRLAEQLHARIGSNDPFISIVTLWSWSWYCWLAGTLQDMLTYALRATRVCRETYRPGWEPMAMYSAAWAYMQLGQVSEGQRMAIETLEKARSYNVVGAQGWAYLVLSFISFQRARYEEAQPYAEKALAIAHMLYDRDIQARVLWGRSLCAWRQRKWDDAVRFISEAIYILQQEGAVSMVYPHLLAQAAHAHLSAGHVERAQQYLDECGRIVRERGYQQLAFNCKRIQARIWQAQGRFSEAERYFEQALAESQQFGDILIYNLTLEAYGQLYLAWKRDGDTERGQALIDRAWVFFKQIEES
jgi:DNA-binding SARP family transcriptional activator/Tfp pilus assembly protein PilF/DNA polymerase III delta prime subunit